MGITDDLEVAIEEGATIILIIVRAAGAPPAFRK